MHVDSLFRPIELAYQLAPVQDAAKHGGLKQIVHLPGMVACMGDEPNHFVDEALGEELDHLQARGFNEVFLTLLVHLALPDVLQRTGDNGRPKGGEQVVLVSFYFEEAPDVVAGFFPIAGILRVKGPAEAGGMKVGVEDLVEVGLALGLRRGLAGLGPS